MKLLLTGATGFVGRNCLLQALPHYEEIYCPIRSEEKLHAQLAAEGEAGKNVTPLPADPDEWRDVEPDVAILCAGVLFARHRVEYFSTNVDWTLRVIRDLPRACRVVILSSQSAGGPTPENKTARDETDADTPLTWYGESKLAMENAIRANFPDREITILRPPMVLGARDTATLPLFKMVRSAVRLKPGIHLKTFSFIAVDDLVRAIFAALEMKVAGDSPLYVASPHIFTDRDLISAAGNAAERKGVTLPVPRPWLRLISVAVDLFPPLGNRVPSLTSDRIHELGPSRWVVDGTKFEKLSGWRAHLGLREAVKAAYDYYVQSGLL